MVCHALTVVTSKHSSRKEWDQVVNQMVSRGADLTDEEIDTVIEYLSKNYGPLDQTTTPTSETPVNVNKASADDLESSLGLAKPEAEAIVKYREQERQFQNLARRGRRPRRSIRQDRGTAKAPHLRISPEGTTESSPGRQSWVQNQNM